MLFAAGEHSLPLAFSFRPQAAASGISTQVSVCMAATCRLLRAQSTGIATMRGISTLIRVTTKQAPTTATMDSRFVLSKSSQNSELNERIRFTNSARRVPDTEKVKNKTTMRRKPRKGARNGLQETPDRGEVRRKADVRGWLPDKRCRFVLASPEMHDCTG